VILDPGNVLYLNGTMHPSEIPTIELYLNNAANNTGKYKNRMCYAITFLFSKLPIEGLRFMVFNATFNNIQ